MTKVVIVDDNESLRTSVERLLAKNDIQVVGVGAGFPAIQIVPYEAPDVLLLDVGLPDLDGWQVLERLKKERMLGDTRVIMLTASAAEADYLRGWRMGVADYLSKPCPARVLLEAVEAVVAATPEQIIEKQTRELEKAQLLHRIETAFGQSDLTD